MFATRAGLLALTLVLHGCAAVSTADGRRLALTSPEFRAYVEGVFREQNRVADALAFALEDARGDAPAELVTAEEALLAACAGLNELATTRRDETRLGARRGAATARGVPECERATRLAASALEGR